MHFQVCEGLDRVVGEGGGDRKSLLDFEKDKLEEIGEYISRCKSTNMVQAINKKVASLLDVYTEQEKGVLPFTWGKDVTTGMQEDETAAFTG